MSRLIDDLRARGARLAKPHFVPPDKEQIWADMARRTHDLLMEPQMPVLVIDNVADYFFTSEQEYWDLTCDFPNLAPPFPVFWAEHRLIKTIHSKECGDTDLSHWVPRGRIGMLIHGLEPDQCTGDIPANARWILWCELFIDYGMRGITATGPHGPVFLAIDAQGRLIDRPWMQSLSDPADAEIMKNYMTWFNPALLAVSFLHCKNVTLIDNRVDAPLAKKWKARHGILPCAYKTLVIEPLRQILGHQGRAGEIGLQRALHICRGHFKDYREGRGLFGKYHQLVWQPAIVRGSRGEKAPPREIEVKI